MVRRRGPGLRLRLRGLDAAFIGPVPQHVTEASTAAEAATGVLVGIFGGMGILCGATECGLGACEGAGVKGLAHKA